MHDIKTVEKASHKFAADLATLRDDITKLTASVSKLVREQASDTTSTVFGAVDGARQKLSDGAAEAQNRISGVSSDFESTIERNPLAAVLAALIAGLVTGLAIGMINRTGK